MYIIKEKRLYNAKPIIMKFLKITLLTAIFCVTFSGVSTDQKHNANDLTQEVEAYQVKRQHSVLVAELNKAGSKKPGHNM